MKIQLVFDEINALEGRIRRHFDEQGHIASRQDCEAVIDEMLDMFLLAYLYGVGDVRETFTTSEPTTDDVQAVIYKPVDGATWVDRVWTWFTTGGTIDDIMRIADTEAHRIYNEAAYDTAVRAGAVTKTWQTMGDERVRDTHDYLQSTTVPIDAEFWTYDGDRAMAPGGFILPENNINCRCWLTYS